MTDRIDDAALDALFRTARTRNGWTDRPVDEALIRELHDLVALAPTSANSEPARYVWVNSPEGREQLAALASGSNGPKIRAAPLTVIIGYDLDFADKLDQLYSTGAAMMKGYFKDTPATEPTAFRNSSLQGAYLILAARALGLDAGPMSGFDNAKVDEAFFPDTRIKSNFICSLGYGNDEGLFPRLPRLAFEEAGRFA